MSSSKKSYKDYAEDVFKFRDLEKCAYRYLTDVERNFSSEEQYLEDEKYAKELSKFCSEYVRKIEKKFKNTGRLDGTKSIVYEYIVGICWL